MTVRLTIRTAAWRRHVESVAGAVDGIVPVVKGNGYGFGRQRLAAIAAELADTIAVGTVHELDGMPDGADVVVLTPALEVPAEVAPERTILTVGNDEHVRRLGGWAGRVIVKLASPMRRFGRGPELVGTACDAGLDVVGVSIHPPLAGTDADHRDAIAGLLPSIEPAMTVWLSHIEPATYAALPSSHRYRLRLGTALWHGDKSLLHLDADVLDVHPVRAGDRVGYRQHAIGADGHLVVIGAGSAAGISELRDGRSPFHHQRRRLPLVEPPHMHTSMVFVPLDEPAPAVGDRVDVQRPLITTAVDEYVWL